MVYTDTFYQGYTDEQGVRHTDFSYTVMTGKTEENISKGSIKANAGKVIRTILEDCVTSIGTLQKEDFNITAWRDIIQTLTVNDQDYALTKIRAVSLGDELEVSHECPSCNAELRTLMTVDELATKEWNGEDFIQFELPMGFQVKTDDLDEDGKPVYTNHKRGVMRRPNGLDREELSGIAQNNVGMANTMMLARVITEISGEVAIHNNLVRDLTTKDRTYLINLLTENSYGILLETEIICTKCGKDFVGEFNSVNFI